MAFLSAVTQLDGDLLIPLADARTHLNLTATADDSFHDAAVRSLRDAAADWVENYTGRSLQSRQFQWDVDGFCSGIRLPRVPVTNVGAVNYFNASGVNTALTGADWRVGSDVLMAAAGTTWPADDGTSGGVRITFTAGYANTAAVPDLLIVAVKLAMTAMFEERANPDFSGAIRCAYPFWVPVL